MTALIAGQPDSDAAGRESSMTLPNELSRPDNHASNSTSTFQPTSTQSARCSKMKLRLYLDSNVFIAGGNIYGRMELTSSTSRSLMIGEISVELTGYEEVCTHEVTASQSFLSARLLFQGVNVPPSNAVHGSAQKGHFWLARKGVTTFPFAFRIPKDAPSTVIFQNVASLRYVVTGLVQIFFSGREDTVFRSKEAFVIESRCDDRRFSVLTDKVPVVGSNSKQLFLGGPGLLHLDVLIERPFFTTGQNIPLEVRVRNDTRRSVRGLRVSVGHRLRVHVGGRESAWAITQTVSESSYNSDDFAFPPGIERLAVLNVSAPPTVRSALHNALFKIECFLSVACYIGTFHRDLAVELPLTLLHAASLGQPIAIDQSQNRYLSRYNLLDEDAIIAAATAQLAEQDKQPVSGVNLVDSADEDDTENGHPTSSPQRVSGRNLPWNSIGRKSYSRTPSPEQTASADKPLPGSLTSLASGSDIEHGRLLAGSPCHEPASPLTYVPAHERVRYAPFRAPPTAKAMESPLRPLLYTSEMHAEMSQTLQERTSLGIQSHAAPTKPVALGSSTLLGHSNPISHTSDDMYVKFKASVPIDMPSRPAAPPRHSPILITRTPPTGEGLTEMYSLREEIITVGSLPTHLEGTLHRPLGPRPMPFSSTSSAARLPSDMPQPLPVHVAADAPASNAMAQSGISRLFQWGAQSLEQMVMGSSVKPSSDAEELAAKNDIQHGQEQSPPTEPPSSTIATPTGAAVYLPGSWEGKQYSNENSFSMLASSGTPAAQPTVQAAERSRVYKLAQNFHRLPIAPSDADRALAYSAASDISTDVSIPLSGTSPPTFPEPYIPPPRLRNGLHMPSSSSPPPRHHFPMPTSSVAPAPSAPHSSLIGATLGDRKPGRLPESAQVYSEPPNTAPTPTPLVSQRTRPMTPRLQGYIQRYTAAASGTSRPSSP